MASQYLKLRQNNCRSCHKCIRHCPLKAIRFSGNHARIISDDCIWCGTCYAACPQVSKEIFSERYMVEGFLHSGEQVIAVFDPTFAAQYPYASVSDLAAAVKALGFFDAREAAASAMAVETAYADFAQTHDLVITSACQAVNLLIQKYYPSALPYLAPVASPMTAAADAVRRDFPKAKVVFVGPCIAKKDEADREENVDAVLTFDQLDAWFAEVGVTVTPAGAEKVQYTTDALGVSGGIVQCLPARREDLTYVHVSGVKRCMDTLDDIVAGKVKNCFIEMSACDGGCVAGPGRPKVTINDISRMAEAVGTCVPSGEVNTPLTRTFEPIERSVSTPDEETIREILLRMGKTTPEDQLNCGGCGYSTCRDKAIAIYRGKADVSMCLPYLKEKAETFSDTIISNTPNGVMVLNQELEVQQINRSAMNLLGIDHRIDIMGEPISTVLEPEIFVRQLEEKQRVSIHRRQLQKTGRYVEMTVILDPAYHIIMIVLRDVTEETVAKEKKDSITAQTVDIADKVVAKQMRIVQDIASLLGETAAETKIALYKLKESITDE